MSAAPRITRRLGRIATGRPKALGRGTKRPLPNGSRAATWSVVAAGTALASGRLLYLHLAADGGQECTRWPDEFRVADDTPRGNGATSTHWPSLVKVPGLQNHGRLVNSRRLFIKHPSCVPTVHKYHCDFDASFRLARGLFHD